MPLAFHSTPLGRSATPSGEGKGGGKAAVTERPAAIYLKSVESDHEKEIFSMSVSGIFKELTSNWHYHYLYNITPIKNIPSIMECGILCYDDVRKLPHMSIAMNEVQTKRDRVTIPGGERLHRYANLYFTYNNPMLYKRKDIADTICILGVSADVLDIEGCIVSDRNAATELVKFYPAGVGIEKIDFNRIYAQYWAHTDNPSEYINHKAIKCAEVLVPKCIPFDYIECAYVVSDEAKMQMEEYGFSKKLFVSPKTFYRM